MTNKVVSDFIDYFNKLHNDFKDGKINEKELFNLNHKFHQETGGKLNHYNMPAIAAVCIVKVIKEINGQIQTVGLLGVKRGIEPEIGGVAFPGGYVDAFETPKLAASRELMEETGLCVAEEDWIFKEEKITKYNQILMFYESKKVFFEHEIQEAYDILGDKSESLDILVIDEDTKMCFDTHQQMKEKCLFECQQQNGLTYKVFKKKLEEVKALAIKENCTLWLLVGTDGTFCKEEEINFNLIENQNYPCSVMVKLAEGKSYLNLVKVETGLNEIFEMNVVLNMLETFPKQYMQHLQCKIN